MDEKITVVPAYAGIHSEVIRANFPWIPECTGTTNLYNAYMLWMSAGLSQERSGDINSGYCGELRDKIKARDCGLFE